jgi:hypothetical protein
MTSFNVNLSLKKSITFSSAFRADGDAATTDICSLEISSGVFRFAFRDAFLAGSEMVVHDLNRRIRINEREEKT